MKGHTWERPALLHGETSVGQFAVSATPARARRGADHARDAQDAWESNDGSESVQP